MHSIIREDLEKLYTRDYQWSLLKNATVLVTGGYGMIASYVVYYLIYLNEEHDMKIKIVCQGRNREKMAQRFSNYRDKSYFFEEYFDLNVKI